MTQSSILSLVGARRKRASSRILLPLLTLHFSLFTLPCQASPLDSLDGVANADVSLDGTWHFKLPAPDGEWQGAGEPEGWKTMPVPGDVFREGHRIKEDIPFAYKKKISVPADFAGQQIRLRFEGAHDFTRVWVNGQFVRDHQGGWTPWECDITSLVNPGEDAWIALEITDKSKDIAFNGKRLRPIGGPVTRKAVAQPPASIAVGASTATLHRSSLPLPVPGSSTCALRLPPTSVN